MLSDSSRKGSTVLFIVQKAAAYKFCIKKQYTKCDNAEKQGIRKTSVHDFSAVVPVIFRDKPL